jgi:hypothetical protein
VSLSRPRRGSSADEQLRQGSPHHGEGGRFGLFPSLSLDLVQEHGEWVERIPLSRLYLANLSRLEYRNLWYSGDRPSSHETRFRNRTELKVAINNDKLSVDGTLYLFADVEFFVPLGADVPERFTTKRRFRGGFGYRLSRKWRFEVLYIRDFARETLEEEEDIAMNALDFRLKLLH